MSVTTQLDRIEALLKEIRDALKANAPTNQIEPGDDGYMDRAPSLTSLQGMIPADDPRSSVDLRYALPPADNTGEMRTFPPVPPLPSVPGKTGPAWCYPNPALTPGKANPLVTQDNISSTLAVSGWTATVRPPVSVTRIIKAHIMARDGLTGDPAQWELDHWFPIECAGAVCDLDNFWCMPYAPFPGAREKDHVENWLKAQIVSGAMTIVQAHAIINDDWFACYTSLHKMGLLPMMLSFDPDGSSDPDDNA